MRSSNGKLLWGPSSDGRQTCSQGCVSLPQPWSSPIKMWLLQFGLCPPWSLLPADSPPSLHHLFNSQGHSNRPAIGQRVGPTPPCFPPSFQAKKHSPLQLPWGLGRRARQQPIVIALCIDHAVGGKSLLATTENSTNRSWAESQPG